MGRILRWVAAALPELSEWTLMSQYNCQPLFAWIIIFIGYFLIHLTVKTKINDLLN